MIININKDCQMSNRIILNAHCLATGIGSRQSVAMYTFGDLDKYYECKADNIEVQISDYSDLIGKTYRKIRGIYDVYREDRIEKYVKKLPSIIENIYNTPSKKHIIQNWYFRNYSDFIKYQEQVRQFFTPKEIYISEAREKIKSLRNEYDILIAVHIRRGDYKTFQGGIFYYTDNQYLEWIKKTYSIFRSEGKIIFIVFSNDQIDFNNSDIEANFFVSHFSAIEDQFLMSECDYIMGPPSTFSWWSSFMGGKPYCVINNADISIEKRYFNKSFSREYTKATAADWYN